MAVAAFSLFPALFFFQLLFGHSFDVLLNPYELFLYHLGCFTFNARPPVSSPLSFPLVTLVSLYFPLAYLFLLWRLDLSAALAAIFEVNLPLPRDDVQFQCFSCDKGFFWLALPFHPAVSALLFYCYNLLI